MASNERVHPNCVHAANPYHECGVACLEQIAQGHVRKEKKKSGSILGGSLSFRKKKNVPGSSPQSPGVVSNGSPVKAVYPADVPSPRSPLSDKKRVESDNSQSSTLSHQRSEESYSQDHSFNEGRGRPSEIVPISGIVKPDGPKSPPHDSFTAYAFGTLAKQKENGKVSDSPKTVSSSLAKNMESVTTVPASPKTVSCAFAKNVESVTTVPASPKAISSPVAKNVDEVTPAPIVKSMVFSLSSISQATEDSDEEDSVSVISDSYVAVGKYHVRPNLAPILQSIIEKYGDIAENCRLESSSLRSYHLECLCSVVQELHSTPFKQLTKAKVKEMLAVLKDVESAQIDVSWLRHILNERTEVIDLNSQCQTAEAEKADCDRIVESTKKELELLTEELAQKEQLVAETKAQIEATRARLNELELESSRLSDTISSAKTKLEIFHSKPLAEGLL